MPGLIRTYESFAHKGANFRIACNCLDVVTRQIVRQRAVLERYIARHVEFARSLEPVELRDGAPEVAVRMARAAAAAGVGPMAAVAGTMAQLAAEAALDHGDDDVIVENGGDVFLLCRRSVVVGLYPGPGPLADRLALAVEPGDTPLAICSSSGRMGHSVSLGRCDLATVVARDAALADAAATAAANLVTTADDIDRALEQIAAIDGVDGLLLVKGQRVGLIGRLPPLVRNRDRDLTLKVTRDPQSPAAGKTRGAGGTM